MDQRKRVPVRLYLLIVLLAAAAGSSVLFDGDALQTKLRVALQPTTLSSTVQDLRQSRQAELIVQRAWLLAQQAEAYDFYTEIEQTTYHAPALTNVGRRAQVESVYLEGATDTRTQEFQLAIWQGGTVLDRDQAYEIRTEGDRTYGRPTGGQNGQRTQSTQDSALHDSIRISTDGAWPCHFRP